MSVTLCICTFRRPAGLKRLLTALATLEVDCDLSVVVVDNDADAHEGLDICNELEREYRWPLSAAVETTPGISFARNTATAMALADEPDFIAMLDDDEWPEPGWLQALLDVQADMTADVVVGPVLPEFSETPPDWMRREGLFGTPQQADRSESLFNAGGNFMAKRECFEHMMPSPFDPEFALSGGEDMVFFCHLANHGYRMFWSAEAIVHELVPTDRMTVAWLKQRQVRRGNVNVIVQRKFAPGILSELKRLIKTGGLLVIGCFWYLAASPSRTARTRATLLICKAVGKVKGHLGVRYFEYGDR